MGGDLRKKLMMKYFSCLYLPTTFPSIDIENMQWDRDDACSAILEDKMLINFKLGRIEMKFDDI